LFILRIAIGIIMILNTDERYTKVSSRLLKKYHLETEKNWKVDTNHFFEWLYETSEDWMPATWRQYKASVMRHLECHGSYESVAVLQAMSKKPTSQSRKTRSNRTSRQKQKKISQEELVEILSELSLRDSKYSDILANWIYTGIMTGVRPIEWHASTMIYNENGTFLEIQNAKHSQRRANGRFRTLRLTQMNSAEIAAIDKQVQTLSGVDEEIFTLHYKACSDLLYRVCRKLWPTKSKYPTLYSARHQFSANAKKGSMNKKEVAALMGHANEDTATLHYGKKRAGLDGALKVSPLDEQVGTVRDSKKQGFVFKNKSDKQIP